MPEISIAGINKAELLAALFNNSKPMGLGFLHASGKPMTTEEADAILKRGVTCFDHLQGRVMKVDIGGDEMYGDLYNRDNGQGAAEAVVSSLRLGNDPASEDRSAEFRQGLDNVIANAKPTRTDENGNIILGIDKDMVAYLEEARKNF